MSVDDNKALIRRFYDDVFNAGRFDLIDELFHDDVIDHTAGPGQKSGIEGIKDSVRYLRNAFPDVHATSEVLLGEGDLVAERWISVGTHRGRFVGVPPTGKRIRVTGINIFRFADGKIAERWLEWDRRGMLRQLSGDEAPDIF